MSIEEISSLVKQDKFVEYVNTLKYMNGDIQDFQKAQILYYKRFSGIIKMAHKDLTKHTLQI